MPTTIRKWFTEHSTLALFLVAQAVAILAYSVRLESRVTILETRGAPYTVERLGKIDHQLTELTAVTHRNTQSIDRIVEILTRENRTP